MSDEEMDVPDMGAGGMDDMSSDGGDFGGPPPEELPEGIKKEIITEAPQDNWRKPKKGDEVFVHYVGTLESDGSEFDSSRSRNKPFNFVLGQGSVIKGWDLGVATMKKGELAKFTLSPEYAYGESGSPPKIPASATLVFEVELLSWTSQDDLFNDGSVIKACVTEGSGWKKPKAGDEVQVSFKAHPETASKCDCSTKDYVVGTEIFGPFQEMVDKALQDMKKGEKCELKCTSEYIGGLSKKDAASVPEGTETVTLELHEIYEVSDVSFSKDKTLMKKQIKEGDGYEKPKEGNNITLQATSAVDGAGQAIAGFKASTLEFVLGNGEVCDALEFAVLEMKKQEQALLTCTKPKMCVDAKLGLADLKCDTVVLTLQLDEFDKGKDTWSMSEDEKIAHAEARKAAAANIFKAGRMELALKSYKGIVDLFNYIDNFKEENKTKANTLKRTCELNRAACLVKIGDWDGGRKACNTVLKDDSNNVKALFRRATCLKELGEFQEAMKDCKAILEQDKANADARRMIPQLKELQKKEDKKSANMFANMCKGLGTFKTPPPQPAKKVVDDDDDDDDEDMGDDDEPMPENGKDDEKAGEKPAEKAPEKAAEKAE